jgi:hypothetical protein
MEIRVACTAGAKVEVLVRKVAAQASRLHDACLFKLASRQHAMFYTHAVW